MFFKFECDDLRALLEVMNFIDACVRLNFIFIVLVPFFFPYSTVDAKSQKT